MKPISLPLLDGTCGAISFLHSKYQASKITTKAVKYHGLLPGTLFLLILDFWRLPRCCTPSAPSSVAHFRTGHSFRDCNTKKLERGRWQQVSLAGTFPRLGGRWGGGSRVPGRSPVGGSTGPWCSRCFYAVLNINSLNSFLEIMLYVPWSLSKQYKQLSLHHGTGSAAWRSVRNSSSGSKRFYADQLLHELPPLYNKSCRPEVKTSTFTHPPAL